MNYRQTCLQHIEDTLPDYQGQELEACDQGMTLTEGENANGSWYCSTYKAQEDLKIWFDDIGDFIEEYVNKFGTRPQYDAFVDAESFHCLMMIMGVEKAINGLDIIQDHWNKKITLDDKTIKAIIEELNQ